MFGCVTSCEQHVGEGWCEFGMVWILSPWTTMITELPHVSAWVMEVWSGMIWWWGFGMDDFCHLKKAIIKKKQTSFSRRPDDMLEMFMLGKSCRMFLLVPILLVSVPGSQKKVNLHAFWNGELDLGDTEAGKIHWLFFPICSSWRSYLFTCILSAQISRYRLI